MVAWFEVSWHQFASMVPGSSPDVASISLVQSQKLKLVADTIWNETFLFNFLSQTFGVIKLLHQGKFKTKTKYPEENFSQIFSQVLISFEVLIPLTSQLP